MSKKTKKPKKPSRAVCERAKADWLTPERLQSEMETQVDLLVDRLCKKIKAETRTDVVVDIQSENMRVMVQFADDNGKFPEQIIQPEPDKFSLK